MKILKRYVGIILLLILSSICVIYFGTCKKGFHEDEYYSYYSTNYTDGWAVGDGSWVYPDRYYQEFVVLPGQEFQYDVVKKVQSWDVHPPMYYWILHTVCSVSQNTFTKWQGLLINIFFYLLSIVIFYMTCIELSIGKKHRNVALFVAAGYAFCPAVISGVMFIRMYTMVSCLVIGALYLHIRGWKRDTLINWKSLLLIMLNVYIGALTHYYYLIFQFFLSLAICIALFINERHIRKSLIYGSCILASIGLAVRTFPKAIWQLFSGYRGTEATDNFFTISNTWERLRTFGEIFWKYLFANNFIGIVILLCIIILIFAWLQNYAFGRNLWMLFLVLIFVGYFFTVSKTALMLGDDAIRYFIPIVSVIYLMVYLFCEWTWGKKRLEVIAVLTVSSLIFSDAIGLVQRNVLFLYPEEEANVAYASKHSSIPVMYIYQNDNSWRMLASADELFQYQLLYFISDSSTDNFTDEYICNCDELMVYITNEYGTEEQIQRLQRSNPRLSKYELVEESKFCNVYHFYDR